MATALASRLAAAQQLGLQHLWPCWPSAPTRSSHSLQSLLNMDPLCAWGTATQPPCPLPPGLCKGMLSRCTTLPGKGLGSLLA